MNDIEKYINGELEPPERRAFEAQLKADPALQEELRNWESLKGTLIRLRIGDKIKEVDEERRTWLRQRLIRRIITGMILAGLAGLAVFIYTGKGQSDPVNNTTPQEIQLESSPAQESPTPVDEKSLPPAVIPKPIAEGPKSKNNAAEKPILRSINPELDSATNRLIDMLLKMTEYNNRVFNRNTYYDRSTEWKKCVAALRKGNPSEAKEWIYKMEKVAGYEASEAQWLIGIALLEEGRPDDALVVFEKIANSEIHPRRKDALPAVAALRR